MGEPLVIVGAGGFGREVVDAVEAVNSIAATPTWSLMGVVDDAPSEVNRRLLLDRGIPYLGTTELLLRGINRPSYVIGVGAPRTRRMLANQLDAAGFSAATIVHPAATIGSRTEIGAGSVVLAGVRLTTNIRLGRHVHLNPNATIGHDTVLEDFVSVNPQGAISGDCVVGEGALIGVGAVILNQRKVGQYSTVGGAACVVRDVPPGTVVKGVPAR